VLIRFSGTVLLPLIEVANVELAVWWVRATPTT